jgi:hypothetical protein
MVISEVVQNPLEEKDKLNRLIPLTTHQALTTKNLEG